MHPVAANGLLLGCVLLALRSITPLGLPCCWLGICGGAYFARDIGIVAVDIVPTNQYSTGHCAAIGGINGRVDLEPLSGFTETFGAEWHAEDSLMFSMGPMMGPVQLRISERTLSALLWLQTKRPHCCPLSAIPDSQLVPNGFMRNSCIQLGCGAEH